MANEQEADKRLLEFGLGSVTWWGYSSACDLSSLIDKKGKSIQYRNNEIINITMSTPFSCHSRSSCSISDKSILIAGGADGRHVLEILGKAKGETKISISLVEQNLMLYARQMIFLNIVLDDSISSTEKTQMILEVLGNSKYRPSTAKYIRMNVSKLIDICGNEASRDEEQPNKLRYIIQKSSYRQGDNFIFLFIYIVP